MNKKLGITLALSALILLVGAYLLIHKDFVRDFSEKSLEFVDKKINETVNESGTLVKEEDDEGSYLTVMGVIEETNRQREAEGLAPLEGNAQLNIAAQKKVDDMFSRQYFEHDSPTGESAGDLIGDSGYEFVVVGENLALGNYKDDKVLVKAWMDSPGHRANILKNSYTEIGVAVARGTFEGRDTWLAVQHFAKPISACPAISSSLKSQIDTNNSTLDTMKVELETRKAELEDKPETREESDAYNKKVDEYNALVNEYNVLLDDTKQLVGQYNSQVESFNNCAKE